MDGSTSTERRALVAVGNPIHRRILQGILGRDGFTVVDASDTNSALDTLETNTHAFDLLLVDYDLPGLGGLDVIRVLKYLDPKGRTRSIVRVEERTEEISVACLGAGADECLQIPTDVDLLLSTVHALVPNPDLTRAAG